MYECLDSPFLKWAIQNVILPLLYLSNVLKISYKQWITDKTFAYVSYRTRFVQYKLCANNIIANGLSNINCVRTASSQTVCLKENVCECSSPHYKCRARPISSAFRKHLSLTFLAVTGDPRWPHHREKRGYSLPALDMVERTDFEFEVLELADPTGSVANDMDSEVVKFGNLNYVFESIVINSFHISKISRPARIYMQSWSSCVLKSSGLC